MYLALLIALGPSYRLEASCIDGWYMDVFYTKLNMVWVLTVGHLQLA